MDKKVEVKYSTLKDEWKRKYKQIKSNNWGWAFGKKGTQFTKDKFDFCILLAAKRSGKPVRSFIIPIEAFREGQMVKRKKVYPQNMKKEYYAIAIFEDTKDYDRWEKVTGKCPLEEILNKSPSIFENQWDLIAKG